jgi:hypothetical protein
VEERGDHPFVNLSRIIVLANSWKHTDWCLAGIDASTGKWVRPVTDLDDGRVRKSDMKLQGYFPEICDVLDIPLATTGPDFGFAKENRTILPGEWSLCGKASVQELFRYAKRPYYILHNHKKYVPPEEMKRKPFAERTTLQLIHVDDFVVRDKAATPTEKHQWQGVIFSGGRELELNVTDPAFFGRLNNAHTPSKSCLLTMSLGMPYRPPHWQEDEQPVCWKLIAGVIEL